MSIIVSIGLLFTVMGCNEKTDDTIQVTGIEIHSEDDAITIQEHVGILQLSATIAPTNATNKLVTWSISDGTGEATIDQDGLVKAVANGTVTAKVTSKSNTDVNAILMITISNQVTDNSAPLAAAITSANENIDETMIGIDSNQFVQSVKWVFIADQTTYQQAITDAEAVLASAPLTDIEVSDAVDDLISATSTFNNQKQNGTKNCRTN